MMPQADIAVIKEMLNKSHKKLKLERIKCLRLLQIIFR